MCRRNLISVTLLLLLIGGCATTGTRAKKQAYMPKFDFTPVAGAPADTTGISFGLVAARYSEDQPWTQAWPFTQFSKNMGLDFQELLVARGYTVSGPFHSLDEMTYPDKKSCDLILSPSLDVTLNVQDSQYKEVINIFGPDSYRLQGTAYIGGRVTLSVIESLTEQRMWLKSIELPQTAVYWVGEKKYAVVPSYIDSSDPGLTSALAPQMEQFYTQVLQTAWDHLHPGEMAIITKQSQELRAKKVY